MTFYFYVEDPTYIPVVAAAVSSVPGLGEIKTFGGRPAADELYIAVLRESGSAYTLPLRGESTPSTLPGKPVIVMTQPVGGSFVLYRSIADLYEDAEDERGFFARVGHPDTREAACLLQMAQHFSIVHDGD